MPALRTRLILSSFVLVLMAGACGGDEDSTQPKEAADTALAPSTTGAEPQDTTDSAAMGEAEDQTTAQLDAERQDGTEPEQQQADQPDSTTGTEVTATTLPERLGDRFEWCVTVQQRLDESAHARNQVDAVANDLQETRDAYESADDELERAEARAALDDVEQLYGDLRDHLADANRNAARLVRPGYQGREETETIALERSQAAYAAIADPSVVTLAQLAYPRDWWPTPESTEEEFIEEIFIEEGVPMEDVFSLMILPEPPDLSMNVDAETVSRYLEATLSAIASLQNDTFDWSYTIASALHEVDASISSLRKAEVASEAIAAHQRYVEAMRGLDQASEWFNAVTDYWTIREFETSYVEVAQSSLDAGELTGTEFGTSVSEVQQAIQALGAPNIANQLPSWVQQTNAGSPVSPGQHASWGRKAAERLSSAALEDAASRFLLADTGGMAAFWNSLSESCQP